jgi:hypothetical protein
MTIRPLGTEFLHADWHRDNQNKGRTVVAFRNFANITKQKSAVFAFFLLQAVQYRSLWEDQLIQANVQDRIARSACGQQGKGCQDWDEAWYYLVSCWVLFWLCVCVCVCVCVCSQTSW